VLSLPYVMGVICSLFVVRCSLFVVRCLLFVVAERNPDSYREHSAKRENRYLMLFSSSFLILHFTPIAIGGHSMFFIGHFTRFQDYMITGFSSILPIFHFSILSFFNFYRISRLQDFLPFFQYSTFPFFHSSIFTGFQDYRIFFHSSNFPLFHSSILQFLQDFRISLCKTQRA